MTLSPSGLSETDIDGLREEGLGDEEVLAVVMLAGFFQLATSIADALGVELDAQLARGTPEYESFMTD
jgi:alkylhydroperoxidase family enzyme